MLNLIFLTGIYVQYHRFNQIQTDKMCFQLIGRASHTADMSVNYILPYFIYEKRQVIPKLRYLQIISYIRYI